MSAIVVRRALRLDVDAMAELHITRIREGFLPTLGRAFLRRLYARVVRSADAVGYVAVDTSGTVVGFAAACEDLGRLYRRFMLRDGVAAVFGAAPAIARSWRRVLETLRYPARTTGAVEAEILAVAVAPEAAGRGVGRALVDACVRDLARLGVSAVQVVAGADTINARSLYPGCGFAEEGSVEVHGGVASSGYVRRARILTPLDTDGGSGA
jgi:ribosomal protein S18 acetylase RimI-like enzyme